MSTIADFVSHSGFVVYVLLAMIFFLIGNVSLRFDGFNKGLKQALICYGIAAVSGGLALTIYQLRRRASPKFKILSVILALPSVLILIIFLFALAGGARLILPAFR